MEVNTLITGYLTTLGVEYSYRLFRGKNVVPPPFITYWFERERHYGSDARNAVAEVSVVLQLCTATKDFALEERLETLIAAHEFEKSEEYDEADELFVVTYAFTITTKTRRITQ